MESEYIGNGKKYKQLTAEERGKIEAYVSLGLSFSKIACLLTRSKSTICEEIKRGRYNGKYRAGIAEKRAKKRRSESHEHSKWRNSEILYFIAKHLKMKWSPKLFCTS